MTKPVHGYAVKGPDGELVLSSFDELLGPSQQKFCIGQYRDGQTIIETWRDFERKGYRCVPVEIREVDDD